MPCSSRLPPRTLDRLATVVGLIVAGCGALPTAGPTASQLVSQEARDNEARFTLVDIDQRVVATVLAAPQASLPSRFAHRGAPPEPAIGVGDSLVVSIWEAASGG